MPPRWRLCLNACWGQRSLGGLQFPPRRVRSEGCYHEWEGRWLQPGMRLKQLDGTSPAGAVCMRSCSGGDDKL